MSATDRVLRRNEKAHFRRAFALLLNHIDYTTATWDKERFQRQNVFQDRMQDLGR